MPRNRGRRQPESDEDESDCDDAFRIPRTKDVSRDQLKSWRQAALVLNASRRYRYTFDFNKEEERRNILAKIRTHAQALRSAMLFQYAGSRQEVPIPVPIPVGGYGISADQLVSMTRDNSNWHLQHYGWAKGLVNLLKSDAEKGIQEDSADILQRRKVFGSNDYPRKSKETFLRFLWDACQDLTLIILMIAAVASLVLGIKRKATEQGCYDGGSIVLAIVISIIVTAVSDYRQSLEFQSLNKEKQKVDCEVVRGGLRKRISIFDIVVGDVVHLQIGDMVPADGILISGFSVAIDESNMTGEVRYVKKDLKYPYLLAGCRVAEGYGTMLVTGVGLSTEWGLLMARISQDNDEETPLQVHLNGIATLVGTVGLLVAFGVFFVLLIRYFTGHTENSDGTVQFISGKTTAADSADEAVKIFTVAVSIAMVAVPEGLPLAIILTLAYSVKKMVADKILVRKLSGCELMGSATTICSDKTGTITLNQMSVVEGFIGEKNIIFPETDNNYSLSIPEAVTSLLIEGIAHNTTGSVFMPQNGDDIVVSGSPTEKAILHWGLKLEMKFDAVRSSSSVIHAFLFNSEKKRGGVAVKLPNSEVRIHWKGAAEVVLALCTTYIDINGGLVAITEDKMRLFLKEIEDMAVRSLRCLALAFRPYELENIPSDDHELDKWVLPETELVLLGIIGLKDLVRPGVKEAVELCNTAGVKVRMVTGDNIQTATTIALECGILHTDDYSPCVIEGSAFRALSAQQRIEIADNISVMGRSSPNDKLLLVRALRKRGHVVAVTGDGTNDAPALKEADIGLAMGIQGTQVAKDSSDIIILDDDFASIVKLIRWGRSIYLNIQKFIQFQLTLNVAAVIINFIDAVSSGDVPYNAVQLLWVNLIMDTLGLIAMATERPNDDLMYASPIGQRELVITNIVWRNLLTQVLYQVTVLVILNAQFRRVLHLEHDNSEHAAKLKNTLTFNAFIFCQIFNQFNARKPDGVNVFRGMIRNQFFIVTIAVTIVLQVLIITYLGKFTSSVRLDLKLWLLSILIGFISWPLMTIAKLLPVPKAPFSKLVWRNYIKLRHFKRRVRDHSRYC